MEFSVLAVDRT